MILVWRDDKVMESIILRLFSCLTDMNARIRFHEPKGFGRTVQEYRNSRSGDCECQ